MWGGKDENWRREETKDRWNEMRACLNVFCVSRSHIRFIFMVFYPLCFSPNKVFLLINKWWRIALQFRWELSRIRGCVLVNNEINCSLFIMAYWVIDWTSTEFERTSNRKIDKNSTRLMICLRNKQLRLKLRRLKTFFTNRKTHQKKSIERLKGIKTETKKHLGPLWRWTAKKSREDKKWKSRNDAREIKSIKNLHKLAIVILI